MLLSGFNLSTGSASDIDSIHNFYEALVLENLQQALAKKATNTGFDSDYIADVACVALNNLPPRYIRHDVDMMFYLSSQERNTIHDSVVQAVNDAIEYVDSRSQRS